MNGVQDGPMTIPQIIITFGIAAILLVGALAIIAKMIDTRAAVDEEQQRCLRVVTDAATAARICK